MKTECVFLLAYLLGAIPFAYIIARLVGGVDIRAVGDGNVGARNVWRSVGPLSGVATLLADVSKGYLAVLLARQCQLSQMATLVTGFAVVMGHDWTIFLRFRGGQGMAASVGVLLALLPWETLIALAIVGVYGACCATLISPAVWAWTCCLSLPGDLVSRPSLCSTQRVYCRPSDSRSSLTFLGRGRYGIAWAINLR